MIQDQIKFQILTENKREMFDGMRAYHQSEISHANHAITMLLVIRAAKAGRGMLPSSEVFFLVYGHHHRQNVSGGVTNPATRRVRLP